MSKNISIPDEVVISKIYLIRNQKVMLDFDLAVLYQVETKRLNEQVKRNMDRFPDDFMFQLSDEEWEFLRSQFATSKNGRGGRRYSPLAFTEHGVLMLSSVLNSERAIQVNIQIMRIYSKLKGMLMDHKDILLKLEKMEETISKHEESFKVVFAYLKDYLIPGNSPYVRLGSDEGKRISKCKRFWVQNPLDTQGVLHSFPLFSRKSSAVLFSIQ